jgi:hypothetical protein
MNHFFELMYLHDWDEFSFAHFVIGHTEFLNNYNDLSTKLRAFCVAENKAYYLFFNLTE